MSINAIRIHPADAPHKEFDGDDAISIEAGTMVRGIRMPAQNAGVRVRVDFDHRVPRGHVWCHPRTFNAVGLDFDGDRLGILFPKTSVEQAIIEQPNPPETDDTGRAEADVFPAFDAAVYGQLMMNVGMPFYLIQAALTLAETKPELADLIIESIIPDLNHQGQIGVDNAKHGGVHDLQLLADTSKSLKDMGLTPKMMAWYALARGDIKGWAPVRNSMTRSVKLDDNLCPVFEIDISDSNKSKPKWDDGEQCLQEWKERGVLPEWYTLDTIVNPADLCDDSSPISESFQWFGNNLLGMQEKRMPNGIFQARLPDGVGPMAQKAAQTLSWFNKMGDQNSQIESEDDREDARRGVSVLLDDRYAKFSQWPAADQREFLFHLWHLSFAGNSHQTLLWLFAPDEVIDLMYEFAELWKIQEETQTWTGRVFTTDDETAENLTDCVVKASCAFNDDTGRQEWTITKKLPSGDAKTWMMTGAESNGEFTAIGIFTGNLSACTKKSAVLHIWPNFAGSTTIKDKTKIAPQLIAAGYPVRRDGTDYVFGNTFKADTKGENWWRQSPTVASKWMPCSDAYVRACVANKLDQDRLARWTERQIQRRRDIADLERQAGFDEWLDDGSDVPDMSAMVLLEREEVEIA